MIDWSAIADVSLTGALVVAVVTLWRENLRLVDLIIENNEKSEAQRLEILRSLMSMTRTVDSISEDTQVRT